MTDQQKMVDYYKAGAQQHGSKEWPKPKYVPSRFRLLKRVSGDWPIGHTTQIGPGEFDCMSNQNGAVSVFAENGQKLGLRLNEFEPIAWRENVIA